jgi:hypothetical protein
MLEPPVVKRQATAAILAGLLLLHFLVRWLLAASPFYAPPDYDESITGLMALHFLRGQGEIFFWGQPYMGTLEPMLAALAFWLGGPSTLAMRLTLVAVSSFTLLAVYATGREAGGRTTGLLAGLYWALPPVFLTFDGLYATGGHLESVAAGALFIYGVCRLAFRPPQREAWFALAISVAAGLGFWCSLLVAPLLAACVAALLVARPRLLLTRVPWVMLAGFLAGSAPFWWWNLGHDFMTFRAVEQGTGRILGNLWLLAQGVWLPTLTGAWWDGNSVEGLIPWLARAAVVILIYLPVLGLLLVSPLLWCLRLLRRQNPMAGPLDLLVAAAWGAMLAHAASSYGHTGVTRYAETLFLPLAGLSAWWLARAWSWRKAAGASLLVVLLGFNLATNLLFERSAGPHPQRTTAELAARLKALGVTHALASGRVAYPLTFVSGEGIICSEFFGWRNYSYLEAVKAAPKVALVAHAEMASPPPALMASGLAMIGAHGHRGHIGPHSFWYDFQPPAATKPIPGKGWRVLSHQGEQGLEQVLADRDLASAWAVPSQAGAWLELESAAPTQLAGLTLLAAPWAGLNPMDAVDLRVQTSENGLIWQTAAEGLCLAGLGWSRGHPLVREAPLLEVRFPARLARRVRVTFNAGQEKPLSWPLAEIYLHAPDPEGQFVPAPESRQAMQAADRLVAPYYDEPLGPHPRFPGVPADYRCARVDWAGVLAAARQAVAASTDWAEPQRRLLELTLLARMSQRQTWPDPGALVLEKGASAGLDPGAAEPGRLLEVTGKGSVVLGRGLGSHTVSVEPDRPWLGRLEQSPGTTETNRLVAARGKQGQVMLRLLDRAPLLETWPESASRLSYSLGAGQMSAEGLAPLPRPEAEHGLVLSLGPGQAGREIKAWLPFFLERGRYRVDFRVRGSRQEQPLATFSLVRHFAHRVHDQPVNLAWSGAEDGGAPVEVTLPWENELEPVKLETKITYHGPGALEVEAITLRPIEAWRNGPGQDVQAAGRAGQGR